jgi:hypothetical protein
MLTTSIHVLLFNNNNNNNNNNKSVSTVPKKTGQILLSSNE